MRTGRVEDLSPGDPRWACALAGPALEAAVQMTEQGVTCWENAAKPALDQSDSPPGGFGLVRSGPIGGAVG